MCVKRKNYHCLGFLFLFFICTFGVAASFSFVLSLAQIEGIEFHNRAWDRISNKVYTFGLKDIKKLKKLCLYDWHILMVSYKGKVQKNRKKLTSVSFGLTYIHTP